MKRRPTDRKFQVFFNSHRYEDCSDSPRSTFKTIWAKDAEAARERICQARDAGSRISERNPRYIGLVFDAVLVEEGNANL